MFSGPFFMVVVVPMPGIFSPTVEIIILSLIYDKNAPMTQKSTLNQPMPTKLEIILKMFYV